MIEILKISIQYDKLSTPHCVAGHRYYDIIYIHFVEQWCVYTEAGAPILLSSKRFACVCGGALLHVPPRELGKHSSSELKFYTSHYSISQLKLVNKFCNLNSIKLYNLSIKRTKCHNNCFIEQINVQIISFTYLLI